MLRTLARATSIAVIALVVAQCGAAPAAPTTGPSQFVGTWTNVNAQPQNVAELVITTAGPSALFVHGYGGCLPTFCDWGVLQTTPLAGDTIALTWTFSTDVDTETLSISNGQLTSVLHVHYTDGSGLADYDATDVFIKAS